MPDITRSQAAGSNAGDEARITHITASLECGGAEMMLYKLLANGDRERFRHSVICLGRQGELGGRLADLGVPVVNLGIRPRLSGIVSLCRLWTAVDNSRPDLVQSWMPHADLLGALLAITRSRVPLVWNIQHSDLRFGVHKWYTVATVRLCGWLSSVPDSIICCSRASFDTHARLGFPSSKMVVIPNGIDTDVFRPNPDARTGTRTGLGISSDDRVIGMAAHVRPEKDHATFFKAAARLSSKMDVHYLLCGAGADPASVLSTMARDAGLSSNRVHFLGRRNDMPDILPALDVFTLTSRASEGWPNVLGEAMACGIPCVATDVGDSASIIGDSRLIAPAGDAAALASAWEYLLRMPPAERLRLHAICRKRVVDSFHVRPVVRQYADLYERLLERRAAVVCR